MFSTRRRGFQLLALCSLACLGCAQTVSEPVADATNDAVAAPVAEAATTYVSAPAVVPTADRVATVKHEPIPDTFPRIEVKRLQLKQLQFGLQRADRLPVLLMGALTFFNQEPPSLEAGRLDFTAKENGLIILMASWDEEDESTGAWKSEALTRSQLGQTWIDLGPASWDAEKILFVRECKAGETYSLRTCKSDPPLPILAPKTQLVEMRQGASTLREAMKLALRPLPQTPEERAAWLAYGVPEGAAVIAAGDMQLQPLEGENIPDYLRGAKIYRPVKSKRPGDPVSSDTVKFGVYRAGPLYLMASWAEDEEHLEEVLSYRQMVQEWVPLGRCPWDPEYHLFYRYCEAGYPVELYTRAGHPPMPIVAPSVDLLAKLPEEAAALEVDVMKPCALVGDNIPAYLRGAVIYKPHELAPGNSFGHSMLRFHVTRPGLVYLLASWKDDVPVTPKLNLERTSYRELCKDWNAIGHCPWDRDQWMFVRHCEAGESFHIKTRHSAPPLPIVVKPVDLLSAEYVDSVPTTLREKVVAGLIGQLLIEDKYAELERLVDKYRRPDVGSTSMGRPLRVIYQLLRSVKVEDGQHYTDRIAELDKWVGASPDSLTARVALAGALRSYGWFIRGGGFAGTVSERQFDAFEEQLLQAERVLMDLDERVPRDVGYYAERISIGIGLGASRDDVLDWTLAAAELDPWNEAATGAATMFFLQRWHGEPGDLVRLAETLADATRDECGEALYARVVMDIRGTWPHRTFIEDDFSWERTKQGLADLRRRFPQSQELLNIQCHLACIALDRELAAACFAEIGDDPDLNIWDNFDTYQMRRRAFSPAVFEGDQNRLWMPGAFGARYVRFSPDGTRLLTSGRDCVIRVWDVASGQELRRTALMGSTNCIDFLNDETVAIGGYHGELIVWNWEQDEISLQVRVPERIVSLDCSADGRYLFFAQSDGSSTVLDLQLGQEVHREQGLHGKRTIGVLSADSRLLATAGSGNGIIVHDLEIGRPQSELNRVDTSKWAIAVSADGSLVATGDAFGMVQVWQLDGWKSIADTPSDLSPGNGTMVRSLAFMPDRRSLLIARGGGEFNEKGGLSILPLDRRSEEHQILGHEGLVHDTDLSPDGKTLVSVGADWTLRLYDLAKPATE